jgi:hypothetical protein
LRRNTLELLAIASGVYIFFLLSLRSLVPEEITPSVTLLALPLIVLAVILVADLSYRATVPSSTLTQSGPKRFRARDVQFLSRQVEVAAGASQAYFETILLNRLRELMIDRVSLEMGIEKETVKRELADGRFGPALVRDPILYRLLYGSRPPRGAARLKMLRETIAKIEAWKA